MDGSNEVTILGNGNTISFIESKVHLRVSDGILNLGSQGGSDSENSLIITAADSGTRQEPLMRVVENGELNMYDNVVIKDNEGIVVSQPGAGVQISGYGVFNMYGGIIENCSSSFFMGGGVGIYTQNLYEPKNPGNPVFNMYGGTIRDCDVSGSSYPWGGGVSVYSQGESADDEDAVSTFNMYGGTIEGNTAERGGGVHVYGINGKAVFNMKDGTIDNNTAGQGAGVYTYATNGKTVFNMSGGAVKNNKAVKSSDKNGVGGGIYCAYSSSVDISDDAVIENNIAEKDGGGIYAYCQNYKTYLGDINISGGSIKNNQAVNGGGIFLGYNNDRGVSPHKTVISDCEIKNNSASWGGGIYIYQSYEVEISGCSIQENTAETAGGVIAQSKTELTLKDSEVTNNIAVYNKENSDSGIGGGIIAFSANVDAPDGNIICNNSADVMAADVFLHDGTVALPIAEGMNSIYEADKKGNKIDGWYNDEADNRCEPPETEPPVDVTEKLTGSAALMAAYGPNSVKKTGDLKISKTVTGENADKTKEFVFEIVLDGEVPDGTYGDITFTDNSAIITLCHGESKIAENLPVGINYTVTETENEGYTVTATGNEGVIEADKVVEAIFINNKNGEGGDEKDGSLTIKKEVTNGGSKTKDFKFTVYFENADGEPLTGEYPYDGDKTGTIGNEGTFKLKHGESITISGLPEGTKYKVVEDTPSGYRLIKHGDSGEIEEGREALAEFENRKKDGGGTEIPESVGVILKADKTLDGELPEDGRFTFFLKDKNGNIIDTQTNYNGTVEFDRLNFSKEGTYEYYITEKVETGDGILYDTSEYKAVIEVRENSNGKFIAEVTYEKDGEECGRPLFENKTVEEKISVTVIKEWAGEPEGHNRPEQIAVQLYKDGEPYGRPVILNDKNLWCHTWTGLDKESVWTVDEVEVPEGYEKTVNENGYVFTIINTYSKSEEPTLPEKPTEPGNHENTGDPTEPVGPADSGKDSNSNDSDKTDITGENPSGNDTSEDRENTPELDNTPQTGDSTKIEVWMMLMAVSFAGIVVICALKKMKIFR